VTTHVFYVPGPEGIVAEVQSGPTGARTLYVHGDSLGSILAVTDDAGEAEEQIWYEPFGQTVDPSNPSKVVVPPLGNVTESFTGHVADEDLQLIDMIGRIYDPRIARFVTPDPLVGDPLRSESLNRYSYAWNNPLKWIDPSGFQDAGTEGDTEDYTGFDSTEVPWLSAQNYVEISSSVGGERTSQQPTPTVSDNGQG
jgi:RHS repeat-associated protein